MKCWQETPRSLGTTSAFKTGRPSGKITMSWIVETKRPRRLCDITLALVALLSASPPKIFIVRGTGSTVPPTPFHAKPTSTLAFAGGGALCEPQFSAKQRCSGSDLTSSGLEEERNIIDALFTTFHILGSSRAGSPVALQRWLASLSMVTRQDRRAGRAGEDGERRVNTEFRPQADGRHRSHTQGESRNGEYDGPYRSRPGGGGRKGADGSRGSYFTDESQDRSRGSREFDERGRDGGHGRRLRGRGERGHFDVGADSRRGRYRESGRRGEGGDSFDVETDGVGDKDAMWGYEDEDTVPDYRKKSMPYRHSDGASGALVDDSTQEDGSAGSRVGAVNRDHFFSMKDLPDIGASDQAIDALRVLGVTKPSKIQAISYSAILSGENSLIADQTGSGKTLAYLAPLVQRLRLQELTQEDGMAAPRKPRVLVLAPTAELAQQVHGVAQRLSGTIPFRSCCFTGGSGRGLKTQVSLLQEGVDVLVATPGRVSTLLEAEALSLEDCLAVVLDEVDVLFMDETFKLAPIGTCAPVDTQFIFVTATLPQGVSDMVKAEFPGTKFLLGPGLHRVAPGVEEVVIDCSGPPGERNNEETGYVRKRDALLSQLERRMALRTLVFCNTIQGCRQVENILRRASRQGQFDTLVYHSAIEPKTAAYNMRQFMRSNALKPMVMICTDRSSRGMDFDRAEVEHVLLYDFPRDPIEYMRRVGRTARAGRKGVVTILAWGRQVPLVREIISGNKKGKRLLSLEE